MIDCMVEKPDLSHQELFWRYVTDMAFTIVVFIAFFLTSWGLRYFTKVLDAPRFAFWLRVLALGVLSFGALWCIVFALKGSFEFARNFKCQSQKTL